MIRAAAREIRRSPRRDAANLRTDMKRIFPAILLLVCAAVAPRVGAATTTLSLDTRAGVRTAAAVETVVYDSAWCPAGTQTIGIEADDGSMSFSAGAPAAGTTAWNADAAAAGVRTLTLRADGAAVCTARFLVHPAEAGSATTTLSLDTRTGVRRAAAVEKIAWDTAWCPAGTLGVLVAADDGSLAESEDAPASGTAEWDTAQAEAGVRTLALLADGETFYSARFLVTRRTETQTTPEPVPYAWLDGFALGDGSEAGYETAAWTKAANGTNEVWECYVAGLDPTNATSRLLATIGFNEQGRPAVGWTPELSDEEAAKRTYTIRGKESLADEEWTPVAPGAESDYSFFSVSVEMK